MKTRLWQLALALAFMCTCMAYTSMAQEAEAEAEAEAEVAVEESDLKPGETENFKWNFDIRIRLSHWDRDVVFMGEDNPFGPGPAVEYLRVRERFGVSYQVADGISLNARMVNRWHKFSSHFSEPNDTGNSTWNFPDEVVFDDFNIAMTDLVDGLTVKLGRQTVALGNKMVIFEGTPHDQGRSVYFDGLVASYNATDQVNLTTFALYNQDTDEFLVINDQGRALRNGDQFVTGLQATYAPMDELKAEMYYIYAELDDIDDQPGTTPRNHPVDMSASVHTVGTRIFGKPHDRIDYSIEGAMQDGEIMTHRNETATDLDGCMLDLRLNMLLSESNYKPTLMLEYTYLSGDDVSDGQYEGWYAIGAEYPIWREELLPIMNNGNWTNLQQYRVAGSILVSEKVKLTGAWHYIEADEQAGYVGMVNGVAQDRDEVMGNLLSMFMDWKITSNWTMSVEMAYFAPGNFFPGGDDCEWLRLQNMITF